jgi:hypothetical protein
MQVILSKNIPGYSLVFLVYFFFSFSHEVRSVDKRDKQREIWLARPRPGFRPL